MNGWHLLLAGAGGAVGALLRYAVGLGVLRAGRKPIVGTFLVNAIGSLAAGVLLGMQMRLTHPDAYALLGIGCLGGLTTYSTLNVQTATLASGGERAALARYLTATYAGSWLLLALGYWLGLAFGSDT